MGQKGKFVPPAPPQTQEEYVHRVKNEKKEYVEAKMLEMEDPLPPPQSEEQKEADEDGHRKGDDEDNEDGGGDEADD